EIARRLNRKLGRTGPLWLHYTATALPTAESQIRCFKYVLSQGVKEGLVAKAQHWPGPHAARGLFGGEPLRGRWFDGTRYARARDAARRRATSTPVNEDDFYVEYEVKLSIMPAWKDLDAPALAAELEALEREIELEGYA